MLYMPNQRAQLSHEALVADGYTFTSEGQAAVRTSGSMADGVLPSTGNSTDVFAGFVIAGTAGAPFTEEYNTKVETLTVASTGSVELQFAPVSGQFSVYDNTAKAIDSDASLSDKTISSLTAGNDVTVTYKYSMTVTQARALFGDATPGGYAGDRLGQIGLVTDGTVYTSNFDTSKDWSAATAVKLSANGQLTDQSGSGVEINAMIISLPTTDRPYLGLQVQV